MDIETPVYSLMDFEREEQASSKKKGLKEDKISLFKDVRKKKRETFPIFMEDSLTFFNSNTVLTKQLIHQVSIKTSTCWLILLLGS
jgi:hypothetical protein